MVELLLLVLVICCCFLVLLFGMSTNKYQIAFETGF